MATVDGPFDKHWGDAQKEEWCREHLPGLKFCCFERRIWRTHLRTTYLGAAYTEVPSHPDYPSILLGFEILSGIHREDIYAKDHGYMKKHFQGGVRGKGAYNAIKWLTLAHWCSCPRKLNDPGYPPHRFPQLARRPFHGIDAEVETGAGCGETGGDNSPAEDLETHRATA